MDTFIFVFIGFVFVMVFVGGLFTFGLHAFIVTKIFQKVLSAADDTGAATSAPHAARVECRHCGNFTAADKSKCASCGAPLEPV